MYYLQLLVFVQIAAYLIAFVISLLIIRILFNVPAALNHQKARTQLLVEIARKKGVDEEAISTIVDGLL